MNASPGAPRDPIRSYQASEGGICVKHKSASLTAERTSSPDVIPCSAVLASNATLSNGEPISGASPYTGQAAINAASMGSLWSNQVNPESVPDREVNQTHCDIICSNATTTTVSVSDIQRGNTLDTHKANIYNVTSTTSQSAGGEVIAGHCYFETGESQSHERCDNNKQKDKSHSKQWTEETLLSSVCRSNNSNDVPTDNVSSQANPTHSASDLPGSAMAAHKWTAFDDSPQSSALEMLSADNSDTGQSCQKAIFPIINGLSISNASNSANVDDTFTLIGQQSDKFKSKVVVPFGWQRIVEEDSVMYYSASNIQLSNVLEVSNYLLSTTTCKCGLECPFLLDEMFNFDPKVWSEPWSMTNSNQKMVLCQHRHAIIAMATLQSDIQAVFKDKKTKRSRVKRRTSPFDGVLVSQLLAQREKINQLASFTSPQNDVKVQAMNIDMWAKQAQALKDEEELVNQQIQAIKEKLAQTPVTTGTTQYRPVKSPRHPNKHGKRRKKAVVEKVPPAETGNHVQPAPGFHDVIGPPVQGFQGGPNMMFSGPTNNMMPPVGMTPNVGMMGVPFNPNGVPRFFQAHSNQIMMPNNQPIMCPRGQQEVFLGNQGFSAFRGMVPMIQRPPMQMFPGQPFPMFQPSGNQMFFCGQNVPMQNWEETSPKTRKPRRKRKSSRSISPSSAELKKPIIPATTVSHPCSPAIGDSHMHPDTGVNLGYIASPTLSVTDFNSHSPLGVARGINGCLMGSPSGQSSPLPQFVRGRSPAISALPGSPPFPCNSPAKPNIQNVNLPLPYAQASPSHNAVFQPSSTPQNVHGTMFACQDSFPASHMLSAAAKAQQSASTFTEDCRVISEIGSKSPIDDEGGPVSSTKIKKGIPKKLPLTTDVSHIEQVKAVVSTVTSTATPITNIVLTDPLKDTLSDLPKDSGYDLSSSIMSSLASASQHVQIMMSESANVMPEVKGQMSQVKDQMADVRNVMLDAKSTGKKKKVPTATLR